MRRLVDENGRFVSRVLGPRTSKFSDDQPRGLDRLARFAGLRFHVCVSTFHTEVSRQLWLVSLRPSLDSLVRAFVISGDADGKGSCCLSIDKL